MGWDDGGFVSPGRVGAVVTGLREGQLDGVTEGEVVDGAALGRRLG